jgi:hypothetical protein
MLCGTAWAVLEKIKISCAAGIRNPGCLTRNKSQHQLRYTAPTPTRPVIIIIIIIIINLCTAVLLSITHIKVLREPKKSARHNNRLSRCGWCRRLPIYAVITPPPPPGITLCQNPLKCHLLHLLWPRRYFLTWDIRNKIEYAFIVSSKRHMC